MIVLIAALIQLVFHHELLRLFIGHQAVICTIMGHVLADITGTTQLAPTYLYIEAGPSWQIQATPVPFQPLSSPLQWRQNERDGVSNHQPDDCLLNRLFKSRSKKISKLRITDLCEGNSPVTGEFPAQRASNAENISIWWRHHVEQLHRLTRGWVPISDFRIEPRIS